MKSIIRFIELLTVIIKENFFSGSFERQPEPFLIMDEADQVKAWHLEGKNSGQILPVYHLCAKACSDMVPQGGIVVDLACGSGRFAMYLATIRPDIKIIGFDLSNEMIQIGNLEIQSLGLSDRIELRRGDLTSFANLIPDETNLITSIFAIHHLPTKSDVEKCFKEFSLAQEKTNCSIWLFDLARPKYKSSAKSYPNIFTPESSEVFQQDSYNSLLAAYTPSELYESMSHLFPDKRINNTVSKILPFYQAIWLKNTKESVHPKMMVDSFDRLPYRVKLKTKALDKIISLPHN